jgi:HK97 family phage portal protein
MGLLAEAVRSWLGPYGSNDPALQALFGGRPTAAGVSVNEQTALNISAVWCAINIIAGGVSALPLILYKRLANDGKERFTDHPVYRLLHDEPNPETVSMTFRETLQAHALTWGNGYAEIQRDETGRPVALWQITPDRVRPFREPTARAPLRYDVIQPDGRHVTLDAERMLHVPGLGWDGTQGYSVIHKARESLGLLAATEKFGAKFFGNSATAGLTAHHPGKLSETAHARLKTSLNAALTGDQAHSLILLEEGVTIEKVTIPPNDAQFLETRKFQVTEVARWFNIPPHMLKDLDRATFSNIEQQSLEFVIHTLTPWLVRWEQELERKLIRPLERRQQFIKHNVNALLRGDTLSRYQAHAIGRQWGWLSPNDILKLEDQNPIGPQGDIYLVPSNMAPAERIDEIVDAQIAPKPAPAVPASTNGNGGDPDPDARMRTLAVLVAAEIRPELAGMRMIEALDIAQATAQETVKALPPVPEPDGTLGERLDVMEASARVTAAELAARLDAAEAARQAQAARIAGLVPSLRDVIEGAIRKEVRFEADRARKAAQSPEKLRAWIGTFYATREDTMVQFVLPAMRLHFALTGRAEDAEAETRRLIAGYVTESRDNLGMLLEHSQGLEADVKAMVVRWETERPARIADELLREVIANV